MKRPEESQTEFALRMVREEAVTKERDRILAEVQAEWAEQGYGEPVLSIATIEEIVKNEG